MIDPRDRSPHLRAWARRRARATAAQNRAAAILECAALIMWARAEQQGLGWPPSNRHVLDALAVHAGQTDLLVAAVDGLREDYNDRGEEPADEVLLYLLGLTLDATTSGA